MIFINLDKPQTMKLIITWCLLLLTPLSLWAQWTWKNPKIQGNPLCSVDFTDVNTGFAVGEFGTILKTTNGGQTWEFCNSGTQANQIGRAHV